MPSAVFWLSSTKRPTPPRHLAPIKSFGPHGSEVSSSSSSYCLAAGRANLRASCSFIHKLLILFNHCAKINNHSYLTLRCLKPCINTTPLSEFTHIQFNRFCSVVLSGYIRLYSSLWENDSLKLSCNLRRQIIKAYVFFPFIYCDLHA